MKAKQSNIGRVVKAEPYGFMDCSSYDAQNKLLRQYNFPLEFNKRVDKVFDVYSDRIPGTELVWMDLTPSPRGQWLDMYAQATEIEKLDKWMKTIAENCGMKQVTGWRILRFTNKMSGYPLYRYDFYYTPTPKNRKLYSGDFAPNVENNHKMFLGFEIDEINGKARKYFY